MGKVRIDETLRITRILKVNGVDPSTLQLTKTNNGRFKYRILGELEQVGADIQKIIEENDLDPEYPYATGIRMLRNAYNGNYQITEEEKREAERFGLISKDTTNQKRSIIELSEKETSLKRALKIARILKVNGVDLSTLQLTKIVNGRTKYRLLEELEQEGVDIPKIIEENELDGKFEIGAKLMAIKRAYNGVGVYEMDKKERREVERIGLISKAKGSQVVGEEVSTPESLEQKEQRKRELMRKTKQARTLFEKYYQLEDSKGNR